MLNSTLPLALGDHSFGVWLQKGHKKKIEDLYQGDTSVGETVIKFQPFKQPSGDISYNPSRDAHKYMIYYLNTTV